MQGVAFRWKGLMESNLCLLCKMCNRFAKFAALLILL